MSKLDINKCGILPVYSSIRFICMHGRIANKVECMFRKNDETGWCIHFSKNDFVCNSKEARKLVIKCLLNNMDSIDKEKE